MTRRSRLSVLLAVGVLLTSCGAQTPDHTTDAGVDRELDAGWVQIAPPDEPGTRLQISGRVLDEAGAPLSGAEIYVFHADAAGRYGNEGDEDAPPRLSTTVRADLDGAFGWVSVVPGAYGGGPPHLHLFVTPVDAPRQIAALNLLPSGVEVWGPAEALPGAAITRFELDRSREPWRAEIVLAPALTGGG